MPERRWELDQRLTALVIGVAAVGGGVLGVVRGIARAHSGAGRILGAAIEGLGGAMMTGFLALLVLSVGAALWSLLVHLVGWIVRAGRSEPDE